VELDRTADTTAATPVVAVAEPRVHLHCPLGYYRRLHRPDG
jgi:hypothetical protein